MLQTLPPALAALGAYRQFCLYFTKPSAKNPNKADKFPCNYLGKVSDPHDPTIWLDAASAYHHAGALGGTFGVAFVLTEADPFFFIDIDSCLTPKNTWSDLALGLMAAFPNCAVEVSGSGRGLHIIGTGRAPEHGCRRDDLGLEFYTQERFIALTGTNAVGDAATVASPELLTWLVDNYFPLKGARAVGAEWTTGPCSDWAGPTDDDDLIRRALNSVSAANVFGGRASFADLWTANAQVLAGAYPSSDDEWNRSNADSALASHLAFWTGRDCERIRRLMERSALVRGKWEREDYIQSTVLNSCAVNKDVLKDKPLETPAILAGAVLGGHVVAQTLDGAVSVASAKLITGSTFASPDQQVELFKGCVYVRSLHRAWTPGGEMLKPEAFRIAYGGYAFVMSNDNGKVSNDAWEAFTQSQAVRHPQVATVCFRPELDPGVVVQEGGRDMVNIYSPISVPRVQGDATPFFDHLNKLLPDPNDQQILMSYLAACVQHKGRKFQWAPLLQGIEGNGKTFFSFCAAFAIGNKYVHWPKASQLGTQFNGWLYGKLLYCVEDIYTSRSRVEIFEELKPMITGKNLEIQNKGIDQETKDICGNFIFNTNHLNGLRKTRKDRRIAVLYTAQQEPEDLTRDGMGGAYMSSLYDWANGEGDFSHLGNHYGFAVVSELLHTWEIPDHLNPATSCQRAPETSSTHAAIAAGMGVIEQYVFEAIDEGKQGFRDGWVSSYYLTQLLDDQRLKLAPTARPDVMKALGYVPHPHLPRGRVNNAVMPDACKPILYVRENSANAHLTGAAAIAKKYSDSQLTNMS